MATETKGAYPKNPISITAGAALTINSFIGLNNQVCGLNAKALGVADHAWDSASIAAIYTGGVVLVEYAGTITAGDPVRSDAEGHALKRENTNVFIDKAADQAHTENTTLTDDTHFTFTAHASGVYKIRMVLHVTNADASNARSIKINMDVPTGATFKAVISEANADADTVDNVEQAWAGAADYECSVGISGAAIIYIDMVLTMSTTGGAVTLQHAQKTSDTDALTVKAGSIFQAVQEGEVHCNGHAIDAGTDGTIGRIMLA